MARCVPTALRMLWVFVFALSGGLGCASLGSDLRKEPDGTFVHRELGFRIRKPAPVGGVGWERETLDGTVIAFRYREPAVDGAHVGATTLVMMADCSEHGMTAQLEARNLRLGLDGAAVRYSGPVSHLGHPGWGQRFETRTDGRIAHVGAVTLVVDRCTYDWVIVTPHDSPELFDAFEAWWAAFQPGPSRRGGAGAEAG